MGPRARSLRRAGLRYGRPIVVSTVAGLALLVLTRPDWADNVVNFTFHTFQDSRAVTVLAPLGSLDKDFTDRTGLRLRFGVDAISAASDGCVRCHPQGRGMQRTYFGAALVRKLNDWKLNVGSEISRENFYASDTLMASITRDFNKGNTTIAGGYSYSSNRPKLHPSDNIEHQSSQDAYVSLTQTLSKTTIVQFTYDVNQVKGYQSSPFLRTNVNGVMVLGNVPDARTRQAFSVRLRQALPASTYLEADVRRYSDTWSIGSNTFSLGLSHEFGPSLLIGGNYRWYTQTGASFYQPFYVGDPLYYTGDFRLEPFNSGQISGRIAITPELGFWGMPKGSTFSVEYQRYSATNRFAAATLSAGVKVPF
ncbi:MAG: DUF3570 domain-containing protein [Bacteroidales bacterium]